MSLLKKVLVVDDAVALHQTYQITLARYKCPVLTALSGQEGLDILAQNPDINLLIVDMYMPRMSGFELIKKLKEQEAFKDIPLIAVIRKEKEEYSQEALQLAEGILKKPFTSTEIHSEVARLFPESAIEPRT